MGVGTPRDLLAAVHEGIDMFDCVLPTRNGRNGGFFTDAGLLNIRNQQYRDDERPIDERCECDTCRRYSRAYLRHLFQTKEILGCRLATFHNLHYYHRFMFAIRQALEEGSFDRLYRERMPLLTAAYPDSTDEKSAAVVGIRAVGSEADRRVSDRNLVAESWRSGMNRPLIAFWIALTNVALSLSAFAEGGAAPASRPGISQFIPLILIFGVFYFMIIRPQQKKQKMHSQFLTELKRGDMVVTNAGIIGTIKQLSDKFVTLEVDDGVCLKMLRSVISESAGSLKDEPKPKPA
jgi:preprotein translocase YajC subunit